MERGLLTYDFEWHLPPIFPSPQRLRPLLRCDEATGHTFELFTDPDGRLRVVGRDMDGKEQRASSRPITATSAGRACRLAVAFDRERAVIAIDGVALDDGDEPYTVVGRPPPDDEGVSLVHPRAAQACATQLEYRRKHYFKIEIDQRRPENVPITLAEAKGRLAEAAAVIRDAFAAIGAGRIHHLRTIRAELRALLVESFDKKDVDRLTPKRLYDPLLFRVAGMMHAPLPVFAVTGVSSMESLPVALRDVRSNVTLTTPSLRQKHFTGETLMDIRDWLEGAAMHRRQPDGSTRTWRHTDIISQAANSLGASHTDPSVPPWLLHLERQRSGEAPVLAPYLAQTAMVVADLADFLTISL